MPIRPERRALYPSSWPEIRAAIRARAGDRCETCGVRNRTRYEDDRRVRRVVLTVAHLYEDDEATTDTSRLILECQLCHNRRDAPMRARHAAETRRAKREAIQPPLPHLEIRNADSH